MQAECDSWLHGIIARSPQRLPGRRRRARTPLAPQRPPLRTRTPSVTQNKNDPVAVTLRRREEEFEKTIQEWVAWREREMESLRKLETELRRRAERISRREISLIVREQKLKRREASLNLRESELHDKALQQEHKERTNQVVEQIESRGRLQYMENKIQQLRSIVSSIQKNSAAIDSSPQESSVKGKFPRNRTTSNNASFKSQNTLLKEKQQSRGLTSCASIPCRGGK
ncbi:hypothetical protein LSM04_004727 [Trypanosoma melophagium]|uniref:uncharacterized protein n=1 Tax=Trypanosoma melophagium TaxID=715481 RepID=UPI00351A3989|nr:hypothetical protein LSM04_004727 [Trypanosoma melophagium]